MTAADLAAIYGVPVSTIYAWASLDRWRRKRYTRPRLYNIDDAQASYDRRSGRYPRTKDGTTASR